MLTTTSWACSPSRKAACATSYLAKVRLLPVGQRIFIRIVQPINGWRDLPKTIFARIPAQ